MRTRRQLTAATFCGWTFAVLIAAAPPAAAGQQPSTHRLPSPFDPMPAGRRIDVSDGDTIVVNGDDRIRVVRRQEGTARIVLNREKAYVLLLVDYDTAAGADGLPDQQFIFTGVQTPDAWPLDARWQGQVTIEEEATVANQMRFVSPGGVAVATPAGTIQFVGMRPIDSPVDTSASITVRYMGTMRGDFGTRGLTMDQAEEELNAKAAGDGGTYAELAAQRPGFTGARQGQQSQTWASSGAGSGAAISMESGTVVSMSRTGPAPDGAVRVGGNVRPPKKLTNVDPVYPDAARLGRVAGAVIVELTIDIDGTVKDARVLRSIPLFDQAAIDAVRQWTFEPTIVGGRAVPVIMTAIVPFGQQPRP